jgi:hypothetical protein
MIRSSTLVARRRLSTHRAEKYPIGSNKLFDCFAISSLATHQLCKFIDSSPLNSYSVSKTSLRHGKPIHSSGSFASLLG